MQTVFQFLGLANNYIVSLPSSFTKVDWALQQTTGGSLAVINKPAFAQVAFSGMASDLTGSTTAANVAYRGTYVRYSIFLNLTLFNSSNTMVAQSGTTVQTMGSADVEAMSINTPKWSYTGNYFDFYLPANGIWNIDWQLGQSSSVLCVHLITINGTSRAFGVTSGSNPYASLSACYY